MMNMQRDDAPRAEAAHGGIEQHGGVKPAAQGDREKRIGGKVRVRNRRAHRLEDEAAGWGFVIGCHESS